MVTIEDAVLNRAQRYGSKLASESLGLVAQFIRTMPNPTVQQVLDLIERMQGAIAAQTPEKIELE